MQPFKAVFTHASLLFRREPWWAEFWSAATAVGWAGLSYASVEDLSSWPSMQVLLRIGDDRFWHLVAFGLGTSQLVFLVCDHRWLRWANAILLCWFWALLTLGVWVAVPRAPAVAVYAGWCAINMFSILRLIRNFE